MAFYVGDIPAEDIVIEPARQGIPIELEPFNDADAILRDFDGVEVISSGFLVTLDPDEDSVTIEWPDESVFAEAGLYSLTVTLLSTTTGRREQLAPVYLVAQANDGWHTLDSIRAEWSDAPSDDFRLFTLLEVAKGDVIAYAPALPTAAVPLNYQLAQAMQTRNIWNAGKVDPASGGMGDETFVIRPFPLDWQIKQILRPKRAVPVIG